MSHSETLQALTGRPPPRRLRALMMLLAGEHELLEPEDRAGLHPLVVPLARAEDGQTIGLLRWATPPRDMPWPLVSAGELGMRLLANSPDQWIWKELATRDADKEHLGGLVLAANRDEQLYEPGDLEASKLPLMAYLVLRVGGLPEVYEELALRHLERGDVMAALVTADRLCNVARGWALGHAFRSELLAGQGRHEAAADSARAALVDPVWTLGRPFEPVARRAGWKHTVDGRGYRLLAEDTERSPLDRAAHWLDAWAVDGGDWDELRPVLAELYDEGGLPELARFVTL